MLISNKTASGDTPCSPQTPENLIGRMRLAHFTTLDELQPWSPDALQNQPCTRSAAGHEALAVLSPKKIGGACLRTARALRRKLSHLETPKKRDMRKMHEEFVRECQEILDDDEELGAMLFMPEDYNSAMQRGVQSPTSSRGMSSSGGSSRVDSPTRSQTPESPRSFQGSSDRSQEDNQEDNTARRYAGGSRLAATHRSAVMEVPPVAVRDMFIAVYDNNMEMLETLLAKYPDALLGSWSGMSVLRYAFMVHTRLEDTECLMLLLNRFTLLNQRHGALDELKSVFADALLALRDKSDATESQTALAVCFENYIMAHGAAWIAALAARLSLHSQPVQVALGVMKVLAHDALGAHASLPAAQSLCHLWGADLAMMAAAHNLQLAPIPANLCGRGHQVAQSLLHALDAKPELNTPRHAALRNIANVLLGKDIEHILAELTMLLDDQNLSRKRFSMRAANSM